MSIEAMKLPEHTITIHDHPEPQIMQWSDLELAAVKKYAEQYALRALSQQPDNQACKSVQKRLEAQQPATPEPVLQAGLTNDQLREAFAEKLPGIDPSERDLTIFALGAEVGAGELAAERQMARMYFDERNSARDAWRRAAAERDQLKATTEPVLDVRCEGCGYMTHHREHMGCVRAAKQHTHPAPSVPDDVVRDAERYRWLRSLEHCNEAWCFIGSGNANSNLDAAIDAAMLAAK